MKTPLQPLFKRNPELLAKKRLSYLSTLATCGLLALSSRAQAAVPAADITLVPPVSINLPVITSATGYDEHENDFSSPNIQVPLYTPYDSQSDDRWWDYLVAELLQSRMPVVMLEDRGALTLDTNDLTGNGNMNPRRLTKFMAAMNRANANNQFKIAHLVDTPAFQGTANLLHNYPWSQPYDMSVQSDWNDVWWERAIKIFHDTIPSQYWYRINGRPVIQFWSINVPSFTNQNGNASRLLQFIENKFIATYGEDPVFILDGTWFDLDPTVNNLPAVIGVNSWFDVYSQKSYIYKTYKGFTTGALIPGYTNPDWFNPNSGLYHSSNAKIPRNQGATLKAGLDAAVANNVHLAVIEGWTNYGESAGIYRSNDPEWLTPNQNIELTRSYADLRTQTLRLEAEACDSYSDTSAGNINGTVFRRGGDLDVRALSGSGWAVNNTAANEWIQFTDFKFAAGNYKFPVRYSSIASRKLRLYVDGVALPDVTAPSTGGWDTFDTIYLGTKTLTAGKHTFRVQFVDGSVDLDWLFIKKSDALVTLKSLMTGSFVCAEGGGNSTLNANRPSAGQWEQFSINDTSSNGSVVSGDKINLQTFNGLYTSAIYGGGAGLEINRRDPNVWEQFTLVKVNGSGPIVAGDQVALKTYNGTNYLTVNSDSSVSAIGNSIGMAQTFVIGFTPQ